MQKLLCTVMAACLSVAAHGNVYSDFRAQIGSCTDSREKTRAEQGLRDCNTVLAQDGLSRGARAELLRERAQQFYLLGKLPEAIRDADESIRLTDDAGDLVLSLRLRAGLRELNGDHELARADREKAADLSVKHVREQAEDARKRRARGECVAPDYLNAVGTCVSPPG